MVLLAIGVALRLLAEPANATTVGARPVITGIDDPTAFVFGPGKVIWYVEKATGVRSERTTSTTTGTPCLRTYRA
jgi:hypothetical protein